MFDFKSCEVILWLQIIFQVLPVLLQCLPLQKDHEENSTIFPCLAQLYKTANPQVHVLEKIKLILLNYIHWCIPTNIGINWFYLWPAHLPDVSLLIVNSIQELYLICVVLKNGQHIGFVFIFYSIPVLALSMLIVTNPQFVSCMIVFYHRC